MKISKGEVKTLIHQELQSRGYHYRITFRIPVKVSYWEKSGRPVLLDWKHRKETKSTLIIEDQGYGFLFFFVQERSGISLHLASPGPQMIRYNQYLVLGNYYTGQGPILYKEVIK